MNRRELKAIYRPVIILCGFLSETQGASSHDISMILWMEEFLHQLVTNDDPNRIPLFTVFHYLSWVTNWCRISQPSTVSPLKHGHIWPMNAEVVPLADGAWLVMGGAMQQNYLHGVQGTQGEDEQRNALSMRQTKGHYYALCIYIYIYMYTLYT